MNKQDIFNFGTKLWCSTKKHSPEILMALGIGGMLTTTILAVKATPKALMLIEEKKAEDRVEKLSAVDTVKTTWRCYIAPTIICAGSIGCLAYAGSENYKRKAALATAYHLSETALKGYQEKVIETIGAEKEESVRDAVAKEQLQKAPIINNEVIVASDGETLCFDGISGRYFKSSIESIKKTVNDLNKRMLSDTYISLNDLYYEIGLSDISLGDELGWNVNDGFIELSFSSQLAENEKPCIVINYSVAPKYDYSI